MTKLCFVVLLLGSATTNGQSLDGTDLAVTTPVGLAVLDAFAGDWLMQPVANENVICSIQFEWILKKRFLEYRINALVPGHASSESRGMITYDDARACYRLWDFSSDGTVQEGSATWNANTKTLNLSFSNDEEKVAVVKGRLQIVDEDTFVIAEVSEGAGFVQSSVDPRTCRRVKCGSGG